MLYTLFLISADGQFVKSSIAEFVFSNKLPLVTIFTRENAPAIFESPIKKQVNWCAYVSVIITNSIAMKILVVIWR